MTRCASAVLARPRVPTGGFPTTAADGMVITFLPGAVLGEDGGSDELVGKEALSPSVLALLAASTDPSVLDRVSVSLENVDPMVGTGAAPPVSMDASVLATVGVGNSDLVRSDAENSEYCIELATEDVVTAVTPLSFLDKLEATASNDAGAVEPVVGSFSGIVLAAVIVVAVGFKMVPLLLLLLLLFKVGAAVVVVVAGNDLTPADLCASVEADPMDPWECTEAADRFRKTPDTPPGD